MIDLDPRLLDLMRSLRDAYPDFTPEFVQDELDEIEGMIRNNDMFHLMEVFCETEGRRDSRHVYIRHRVREEMIQKFIAIRGADMSPEQEMDLTHLLKDLHDHAQKVGKKPEAPHFLEFTLMALVHRVLAEVEQR